MKAHMGSRTVPQTAGSGLGSAGGRTGAKYLAVLVVFLVLVWILSGCVPPPPDTPPPARSLSFVVSGLPIEGSRVGPGSDAYIETVTVTDIEGGQRVLRDRTEFQVVVRGGDYDAVARRVRLSADRARIPQDGYEISVSLAADPTIRAVKRYVPDYALTDGPEPGDVAELDIQLLWVHGGKEYAVSDGVALVPGEEYRLVVDARDRQGRNFSSRNTEFPIPRARLSTELVHLTADDKDWTKLSATVPDSGADFGITVNYGGDSRLLRHLSYTNDPAIWQGPEPHTVASFELTGELLSVQEIIPGEVKRIGFMVSDHAGRSWLLGGEKPGLHLDDRYPLPPHRTHIKVENGRYDPRAGEVSFEANARSMIGKSYVVTASYGPMPDLPGLSVRRVLAPDFLSIVPLMEANELSFSGGAGRDGSNGRDGRDGAAGRDNIQVLGRRAGDGKPGGRGTFGQHGAHGDFGPRLRVVAREVRTLDASERLVLFEVRAPGTPPEYHIRRLDDAPVKIISRGGDGGDGGQGGKGGDGGRGGNGYFSGDGGNGGDGGDGGNGGDGGDGGDTALILASRDLEIAFVLDCAGGRGGAGGRDGTAGNPGNPGDNRYDKEAASDSSITQRPERGTDGNQGNVGRFGQDGNSGRDGKCDIMHVSKETEEAAAVMVRRVPSELRAVILD